MKLSILFMRFSGIAGVITDPQHGTTFNSLYEIPIITFSHPYNMQVGLSILFMRFDLDDAFKAASMLSIFQFSL